MSLSDTQWDVIVIGTGVGGGVTGRALAEAGKKVLFLEKGYAGFRTERQGLNDDIFLPEARLTRGYWPDHLTARVDGHEARFYAPLGAGVGGSSVFYAATLERPERHDLDSTPERPHPTGGWPTSFDVMRPWYDQAATQFRLMGTSDPLSSEPDLPLRAPTSMSAGDQSLMHSFQEAGLHPYHLHSAIENIDGCEGCLGRKCPKPCKMDGRSAGVEPALATGRAHLQTGAEVRRLIRDGSRISGVEIELDGHTQIVKGTTVVLAAGALNSPRVLMASTDDENPDGLANSSGLVGCNLMFHLNEMLAIWPKRGTPDSGPSKAISLRDFYHAEGTRMGTVQAMGIDVGYGEIVHYLNLMLAQSRFKSLKFARNLTRLPAAIAAKLFGKAKIFVGLLEDLPYAKNRVLHGEDLAIEYSFQPELLARRKQFRKALRKSFRSHRKVFLGFQPQLNFGHPCGTLVFGLDPKTSVLDPNCRAHDLDNLYVTDASFMPTSMGVNPSLTIAANALRVADHIQRTT